MITSKKYEVILSVHQNAIARLINTGENTMNKHILLVMKWLNDKDSVTQEELESNRKSADAADADADAARTAAYWVTEYFKRSGDNRQDYVDALTGRKQVKLVAQIGVVTYDPKFTTLLATKVSEVCGGCTISVKKGYWMKDGATRKEVFTGELIKETCIEIELTSELSKERQAIAAIKAACVSLRYTYHVDFEWVHLSRIEMTGLHFNVMEL